MTRIWFKDGTYIDTDPEWVHLWEMQPDWDRTEPLSEKGKCPQC